MQLHSALLNVSLKLLLFAVTTAFVFGGASRIFDAGSIPVTQTKGSAVMVTTEKVSHAPATPGGFIGQDPTKDIIVKILNDRTLFGKDFPTALAFLPSWSQINERAVHIFPDRIVGSTIYRTIDEAQQAAAKLREATAAPRLTPNPEFVELLRGVPNQFPFRVEVIPFFPDDGSIRVAWTAPVATPGVTSNFLDQSQPSLQFFDPGLTSATVQQRVGPPDVVAQEVVDSEKDRRPVVLRRFSYGKGAIDFAESDMSLRPGFIDRTIFNVSLVTAVVFVGGPR